MAWSALKVLSEKLAPSTRSGVGPSTTHMLRKTFGIQTLWSADCRPCWSADDPVPPVGVKVAAGGRRPNPRRPQ